MSGFARYKPTVLKSVVDLNSGSGEARRKLCHATFAPVCDCAAASYPLLLIVAMIGFLSSAWVASLMAQTSVGDVDVPQKVLASEKAHLAPAPATVVVKPIANEEEMRQRLRLSTDGG